MGAFSIGMAFVADDNDYKNAYAWNLTKLSEAFGLSRDTIRKRLRESNIQPAKIVRSVSLYALSDVGPALFGVSQTAGNFGGYDSPNEMPSTDRKAWFQSENERLKFQSTQRSLVPDDEVAREMSLLIKSVINPLDGITDTLERKADLSPKQAIVLQNEVDAIREQMYLKAMEFGDGEDE